MRIYSKKLLWSSVVLTNTFALPEWIGTYVYIRLSQFMQKKRWFFNVFDSAYKNPRAHHQIRGFNKNLWHAKWQNSVLPCDSLISKLKTGVLRVYLYSRRTKNLKKKNKKLILGLFWPKSSHINVRRTMESRRRKLEGGGETRTSTRKIRGGGGGRSGGRKWGGGIASSWFHHVSDLSLRPRDYSRPPPREGGWHSGDYKLHTPFY